MDIQEIENVLYVFDEIIQSDNVDTVAHSIASVREKLNGSLPSIFIKQLFVITGEQIKSLQTEKEELQSRLVHTCTNGFYAFKDFLAALQIQMGRTYGYKTDCIKASETSPDCKIIRLEDFQKWIKSEKVPDWAYEQLSKMIFPKRTGAAGKNWKNTEYTYLETIHNADPTIKNIVLASMCSEKFGREITENAIKGSLDRLRKQNRVAPKRKEKI